MRQENVNKQLQICRLATAIVATGLCPLSGVPAEAQNNQSLTPAPLGVFGHVMNQAQQAQIAKQRQGAAIAWASVDPILKGCVQNNAHISIDQLIANGIPPYDPRVSNLFKRCTQAIAADQEHLRQQAAAQARAQAEAERVRLPDAEKVKKTANAASLQPNSVLGGQIDQSAFQQKDAADLALGAQYAPPQEKLLEFSARGLPSQDEITGGGVRVRVVRQTVGAGNGPVQMQLTIDAAGIAPFTYHVKDAYGVFIQIAHLNAPNGRPEVLVRADYGANGLGHYELTIFSSSPSTTGWTKTATDCCVGDSKLGLVHPNAQGSGYFLDLDLGRGTPDVDDMKKAGVTNLDDLLDEAGSGLAATYRVLTLGDKGIVDVTRAPEYRAIQAYRLKEWFGDVGKLTGWKADPKNPVWQALALRYVKIKALLGEFQDGWSFFVGDAGFGTNDDFTRVVKTALVKAKFATEPEFNFNTAVRVHQAPSQPTVTSAPAPVERYSSPAQLPAVSADKDLNVRDCLLFQGLFEVARSPLSGGPTDEQKFRKGYEEASQQCAKIINHPTAEQKRQLDVLSIVAERDGCQIVKDADWGIKMICNK